MSYALEIDQIEKKYDNFKLEKVSFKLEEGAIMGLIGTNGSGKTTLIQIILGLLNQTSGNIKIYGHDTCKEEKITKNFCGFVLDENPFLNNLSARDNGRMFGHYYTKWNQELFLNYLKKFEVDSKKPLRKLSKGTITKFQLAFALAHDPKLIILDEPSAGLDPVFRRELIDLMYDLILTGERSILFSTHLTQELDHVADYITMLHSGKQIFSLPKDELLDTYSIVRGSKTQIHSIPEEIVQGIKQGENYCEALVKKTSIEAIADLTNMRPTIEDVMYYAVNGQIGGFDETKRTK